MPDGPASRFQLRFYRLLQNWTHRLRMSAGGNVQDGRSGKQSNQNSQGKAKKKYSPLGNRLTLPTLARTIPCFLRANNPQQSKDRPMQKKTPSLNYSALGTSTSGRCRCLQEESQWIRKPRASIRWDPSVTVCFGALPTETPMRT